MGRALSALKAAVALAVAGYYTEVEVLLRSAYESASLGRMLAKEPGLADEWLTKNTWVPDRRVRRWIEERRGDGSSIAFADYYRQASNATHPTANAALRSVRSDEEAWELGLVPEFEEQTVMTLLGMCASATAFVCSALRNSAAEDEALMPGLGPWIKDIVDRIGNRLEGEGSRDSTDWEEVERRRVELVERARPTVELDKELNSNPMSWRQLKHGAKSSEGEADGV